MQVKPWHHYLTGSGFNMTIPGTEIYRYEDDIGRIRVFEEGPFRFLAFSEDSQQTAMNIAHPDTLIFDYTQAMLLSLAYLPEPNRVTLLGLGGGSLYHAFRAYSANLQIDAVELRAAVIRIAQEWFYLPDEGERFRLIESDAAEFIADFSGETDIIIADIYDDDGMVVQQLNADFLADCFKALSHNGILVLNVWDQGKGSHPKAKQALITSFSEDLLACPIEDGNLIILAFKGGMPQINERHLLPLLNRVSKRLPFSLSRFSGKLKPL